MVWARRAQRRKAWHPRTGQEIEHRLAVIKVADHTGVSGGEAADNRCELRRSRSARSFLERLPSSNRCAERRGATVLGDERFRPPDHVEAALLALRAGGAPRRKTVAAEHTADGVRVGGPKGRDVETQLKAGSPPVDPQHFVAEATFRELGAIGRRRERNDRVGVEMINVLLSDEGVHSCVNAGHRPTSSEEAVIKQVNHLVFMLWAAVHAHQAHDLVEIERRETGLGERAEVPTGALDVEDPGRPGGRGVVHVGFGRSVASRVVRVPGVATETVASLEQFGDDRDHVPHPDEAAEPRPSTMDS